MDPGNHRAPQRGRQRGVAVQSGPAHRPRGPPGLGSGAIAGPEQRAGRRRHGRHTQQVPRFPGRGRRRGAGQVRDRLPNQAQRRARQASDAHVRGHGGRRVAGLLRHRREPRRLRGRRRACPQAAGRPRHPRGAGHLHDPHRRDGRRGAARLGRLGRIGGHGHVQRAPGAAGASRGAAPRPGPPRHRHHRRYGPTPRRRLGPSQRRGVVGRDAVAVAHAYRHVVGSAGGLRRHPVALPHRRPSGHRVPPRLAVGRRPRGPGSRAVQHHPPRSAQGEPHRGVPRCGSPPAGRSTPTTPGCNQAVTPRPSGTATPST